MESEGLKKAQECRRRHKSREKSKGEEMELTYMLAPLCTKGDRILIALLRYH